MGGAHNMSLSIPSNWRLAKALGPEGTQFVTFALGATDRLLPHIASTRLELCEESGTGVQWEGPGHRKLKATVSLAVGDQRFCVHFRLSRRTVAMAASVSQRSLDPRERDICLAILEELADCLGAVKESSALS